MSLEHEPEQRPAEPGGRRPEPRVGPQAQVCPAEIVRGRKLGSRHFLPFPDQQFKWGDRGGCDSSLSKSKCAPPAGGSVLIITVFTYWLVTNDADFVLGRQS